MSTTTESWLDIIPAIPLALAVPVVNSRVRGGTGARWVTSRPEHLEPNPRIRVDLEHIQGFGYVLWWWCRNKPAGNEPAASDFSIELRSKWLDGVVTDYDRIALARALRKLINGQRRRDTG